MASIKRELLIASLAISGIAIVASSIWFGVAAIAIGVAVSIASGVLALTSTNPVSGEEVASGLSELGPTATGQSEKHQTIA